MKKILLIYALLFILVNVKADPTIVSASFVECELNSQVKIEIRVLTEGPLKVPLNFFINLKGVEELSAFCMMESFPTHEQFESSDTLDQTNSNSGDYYYVSTCTTQTPKYGGNYFIEVDPDSNEGVQVSDAGVYLAFSPCPSQEDAEERKSLTLSFRQVNTFDLDTFSFKFYGLTSQTINSDETITFYFNFLDGSNSVLPSPVEANCTIEESVTEIDASIGIASASFQCLFSEEYVTDNVASLQITSSGGVAGIPMTNSTLMNPKLTDDSINEGLLTNSAYIMGNPPSIISPVDNQVKYNEDQGVITMVFEGSANAEVGQTFEIPLTYPGGINIQGNIIKNEDSSMTIRFGIEGEINTQPLIWEQTIIYINGQESFVLPAYETNSITTKGYSGNYEEEEPETDFGIFDIDDSKKTQEEIILDDTKQTEEIIDIDITTDEIEDEPVFDSKIPDDEPIDDTKYPYDEPIDDTNYPYDEPIDDTRNPYDEPIDDTRYPYDEPIDDTKSPEEEPIDTDESGKTKPTIFSANFVGCEYNGIVNIELNVMTEGPLQSPLNFFINLKGIEELSAYCMMDDFQTDNPFKEIITDAAGDPVDISDIHYYVLTCTTQSPKYGGNYFIEVDPDFYVEVEVNDIYITFSPCPSQEEAEERKSLSLSFRQVNTFDLNTFSFKFYGLTIQTINSDSTITFYFNFLDEMYSILPSPVEANCTIDEPVTELDEYTGTASASFQCYFNEEYVTDDVSSLQITSSGEVAGLPITNSTLMNPKLTDDAINEGLLQNPAYIFGSTSSIVNPVDYLVKYNEDQGVFTMVFEGAVSVEAGQTFEIPLTYPGGINIQGNIIKYEEGSMTIRFGILGEINSLPLIWEQTVIFIDGKETFVLPGYTTHYITTKGYNGYYEEEEPQTDGEQGGGEIIIDDGGNTQEEIIIDDGGKTQEEIIIDDGGKTQEEIIIDDGGKTQEEVIIDDGENTQDHGGEVIIDDGGNTQDHGGEVIIDDGGNTQGELTDQEGSSEQTLTNQTSSEEISTSQSQTQETTEQETTQQTTEQEETESSYTNATVIEETPITLEDATTKSEISISFRQLNGFSNVGSVITFYFYALTTSSISSGSVVTLYVNLIGKEGMDENATAINCTAQEDYNIGTQVSMQAIFICALENIDETQEYTSLRLNSSNDITGIPTEDETALNPYLTDQAIANNEIKDCATVSVPPTFTAQALQSENCESNGQFLIVGELSENKTIAAKFTIPLTYPEGTSISCTYTGGTEIVCVADKTLNGSVVIEKTMITSGGEELFILTNLTSELYCGNGLEIQATQKIYVDISFRQVSHIEKANDTIYFFFAAFVNTNISTPYSIDLGVIVNVGDHKVEKTISCALMEDVVVLSGSEQGDFNCSVPLETDEEIEIPVENVTVSTNNDLIGGCAELTKEETSPYLTDVAISNNDYAESELAYTYDFFIYAYKYMKPPSLKISSFDLSRCASQGKIKLIGTLSQVMCDQIVFELPFSYPLV